MPTIVIGVEPHFATVRSASPFFEVSVLPGPTERFETYCLRILGMLVVCSIALDVVMYAILLVAENIVTIGNALQ